VAAVRKSEEFGDYPSWHRLSEAAKPVLDAQGHPAVRVSLDGREVPIGICRGNALRASSSPELLQDLVLTRMYAELKVKKPRISEQLVKSDWKLLQSAREESRADLSAAGTN